MLCPNCQQPIAPGAAFCGNCGFQLTPAAPAGQAQPSPPPTVQPGQPVGPPQPPPPPMAPATAATPEPPTAPGIAPTTMPQPPYPPAPGVPQTAVIGGATPGTPGMTPFAVAPTQGDGNNKAVAALVFGVLGCVGWLIPIVGIVLGILAIICGTMSFRSRYRVMAIVGMVLAVPVIGMSIIAWMENIKNDPLLHGQQDSSTLKTVSTPCYTTKVPSNLSMTQTAGNCTFSAKSNDDFYEVKVIDASGLTASNLDASAHEDAQNALNALPGSKITNEQDGSFVGQQAYTITYTSPTVDGELSYVIKDTAQGNLILVERQRLHGQSTSLTTLENSWSWQ